MNPALKNPTFSFMMLIPAFLLLLILSLFPLIYTFYQSFHDFYLLKPHESFFNGLENYKEAARDPYFFLSLKNTFTFMLATTVLEISLGLLFALWIVFLGGKKKLLRFLLLIPNLLPPVTAILVWQNLLSYQGCINTFLSLLGAEPVHWLQKPGTALLSLIMIDVWQWAPFCFLMTYTALKAIPKTQYEAAAIDGAQGIKRLYSIELPYLQQTLGLLILLRGIDSFRLFDKVNILTKGGPANSTATISQFIFQKGIENMHLGYAAALSIIMTVIILSASIPGWKTGLADK